MSETVVYAVRAGDLVKIGFTTDLTKRLGTLQNGNGAKLELIGTMPGGSDQERLLHEMFGHCREQGEWFKLGDPELRSLTNVLDRPSGPSGEPVTRKRRKPPQESKWERNERLHRCKTACSNGGVSIRCQLWAGHGGLHEASACGQVWEWGEERGAGPPKELAVLKQLVEQNPSSPWRSHYEEILNDLSESAS